MGGKGDKFLNPHKCFKLLCNKVKKILCWVLKYPYFHKVITQTHPRGDRRVLEKVKI